VTASPRRALGDRMASAAEAWLAALVPEQREAARRPFDSPDRERWFYTPTDHGGLSLGAQRPAQQGLAMRLVATGLSEAAYVTVATVMGLENVLDRLEGWSVDWGRERGRDPGLYWLRIFGDPSGGTWGWRFGGHHVSLNNLVVDGAVASTTPCFIGADPAVSPLLGGATLRPLGSTEDLARTLLGSLDPGQSAHAVLLGRAPSDIVAGNRARVADGDEMLHMTDARLWQAEFADARLRALVEGIDQRAEAATGYGPGDHRRLALTAAPRGVAGADLRPDQRDVLRSLVDAYVGRAPEEARPVVDPACVHFAWAGPTTPGVGHYYRLQGPGLLVEYDNTQRAANHLHTVWRDPETDFGYDVLRAHRARTAHG
jgi:hypothetical protein